MTQDAEGWEETATCVECGAELWPERDRAFAYGPESYLCFECSERRGGVYEADHDRWSVAPDVSGLPDERRAHP